MKSARVSVVAVTVQCPACDACWEGTNGSHMVNEDNGYRRGQIATCRECGERFRLPNTVRSTVLWPTGR